MICTDDGFWFSFRKEEAGVVYTFHKDGQEIETGKALSVDEMWDRFDALVARQRGNLH